MDSEDIIKKLPEKFRDGSVIIDEGDMQTYLVAQVCTIIFFFLVYEILKFFFTKFEVKAFLDRKNDDRIWYVNMWVTMIHHYMILPMIFYALYYSCSNKDGWPWPTKEGGSYTNLSSDKRWGFFKDDMCFIEPNKGYVLIQIFSIGYMI